MKITANQPPGAYASNSARKANTVLCKDLVNIDRMWHLLVTLDMVPIRVSSIQHAQIMGLTLDVLRCFKTVH